MESRRGRFGMTDDEEKVWWFVTSQYSESGVRKEETDVSEWFTRLGGNRKFFSSNITSKGINLTVSY